ncbi:hypothetical protein GCM10028808_42080 [Spirosoma migulaei]
MGKRSFYIDKGAYANLLAGIGSLHTTERKGNLSDFQVYADNTWLADTVIIEQLTRSQGEWQVELLFASIHNPLKFLKQRMIANSCPERAAQQAHVMRKLTANDRRRDITMSIGQMNICSN